MRARACVCVRGLQRGAQRRAHHQIKPTRYRILCSLLASADAFTVSARTGGGFPLMKMDYNQIASKEEEEKEEREKEEKESWWRSYRC